MVGRGWWLLLLWIWFMSLLCAALCGTLCDFGEEYYSNEEGRCLPCTRCAQPEMVVSMPCYLYQDAVCTPTTQFLTNMKATEKLDHQKLNSSISPSNEMKHSDIRKVDYYNESKEKHEHLRFSDLYSNMNNEIDESNSLHILNNNDIEKHNKHYHKHRHRHHGNHRLFQYLENVYKGFSPELNNSVSDSSIKSFKSSVKKSSHGDLLFVTEEVAGATRNKDNSNEIRVSQEEVAIKPKTFILYAVVIIAAAGIALILIIVIQTRQFLLRQRKKTFSSSEHEEQSRNLEESDGFEQLLHPDSVSFYSIANNCNKSKKVITYRSVQSKSKPRTFVRPSLIAAQRPQAASVEASLESNILDQQNISPVTEQAAGYPSDETEIDWPCGQAATMNRLLEDRRRIYGHVFPLETANFYVEQQKKIGTRNFHGAALGMSQPCLPHPSTPLLGAARTSHIHRGSVSASASPCPSRSTYRHS